jgi:hypothetical protein
MHRYRVLCTTEKTHEAEFEKSYSCRFGLRVCRAVFVRLVRAERGFSLSVEKAEARVGRPLTPMSVAGMARRQNRRADYGYGTAAAIGATSPYYTGGGWGSPYYSCTVRGARAAYYGGSPSAAGSLVVANLTTRCEPTTRASPGTVTAGGMTTRRAISLAARPVALVKLDDGQMYVCQ